MDFTLVLALRVSSMDGLLCGAASLEAGRWVNTYNHRRRNNVRVGNISVLALMDEYAVWGRQVPVPELLSQAAREFIAAAVFACPLISLVVLLLAVDCSYLYCFWGGGFFTGSAFVIPPRE